MNNGSFYIGYQNKMPEPLFAFIRKLYLALLVIVVLSAISFSVLKIGFADSRFEYGTLSELSGTLYLQPVPYLEIEDDHWGQNQQVLLVGFGKFGATTNIKEMEETIGKSLEGVQVVLRGTKIYDDGFQLLELTEGKHALVSYAEDQMKKNDIAFESKAIELSGEVIDPKCYFGVMKPGYGKPHRSCASRCLAGGIPAMYVTRNPSQASSSYYILLDEENMFCYFKEYIAENTRITGDEFQIGNLNFIQINSIENLIP